MNHAEYRKLHSAARYARNQVRHTTETDGLYGSARLAAFKLSERRALARVPGDVPAIRPLDPLIRLRDARNGRHRDPSAYTHVRTVCATPRWQLRLMEAAVGAELAARTAALAWRVAA